MTPDEIRAIALQVANERIADHERRIGGWGWVAVEMLAIAGEVFRRLFC
jgi:hypothetical protein